MDDSYDTNAGTSKQRTKAGFDGAGLLIELRKLIIEIDVVGTSPLVPLAVASIPSDQRVAMSVYLQQNRPLRVTIKDTVGLVLIGFSGREAISELFQYRLEIGVNREMPLPLDSIVGQQATVEIDLPSGGTRYIHGIVRQLTQGRRDEEFRYYRLELVPGLWAATQVQHCRTFSEKSVPEILLMVLEPLGLQLKVELQREYHPRNYCVQYNETDFAFVSRLMEDEGISYFFAYDENGHEMVIADDDASFIPMPTPARVRYDENPDSPDDVYRVIEWETSQQLRVGTYATNDFHFQMFRRDLSAQQSLQPQLHVGESTHKLAVGRSAEWQQFEYPGDYAKFYDGVAPGGEAQPENLKHIFTENQAKAKIRLEAEQAQAIRIWGRGNCGNFIPGFTFELSGHWDANGKYLLTSIEHEMSLPLYQTGAEPPRPLYRQQFTAVPASVQFRPPRITPKPVIHGTQTAMVDADGEIELDRFGRIQVKFRWDQSKARSCWVRVAQPWAGKRWGAFFWPRKAHEVVVSFQNGDPDCPLVVGSVYNARNLPPLPLPENQSTCGIKSCSVSGDPRTKFNALLFHDDPENEHLHTHSQSHEIDTSEASKHSFTPGPTVEITGTPPIPIPGSGAGGGPLDVLSLTGAIMGDGEPTWMKQAGKLFPGSARFVGGSLLNSTLLGDYAQHTLGGYGFQLVCDPVGDMAEKLLGLLGAAGDVLGGLTAGIAGNALMVYGPNSSLCYSGPQLEVLRGSHIHYQTEDFWTDVSKTGLASKSAAILTCSSAAACDIAVRVFTIKKSMLNKQGKDAKDNAREADEEVRWSTLLARNVTQRFARLQTALEARNAETEDKLRCAKEANRWIAEATKLGTVKQDEAADRLNTIAMGMLGDRRAYSSQSFDNFYSLSAPNLSISSSSDSDKPSLTISSIGTNDKKGHLGLYTDRATVQSTDGLVNANNLTLNGTTKAVLSARSDNAGPSINLASTDNGSITLKCGQNDKTSISMDNSGITIKFGNNAVTLGQAGIALKAGGSEIKISNGGISLNGLNVTVNAQLQNQQNAVQLQLNAEAIQQLKAAMHMQN